MLDIKLIRESSKEIQAALSNRGYELDLEKFTKIDAERKRLQIDVEFVQSERKKLSNEFASLKKQDLSTEELKANIEKMNNGLKAGEEALKDIQKELEDFLLDIPNIAHKDAPIGKDESSNVVIRQVGEVNTTNSKDHIEITSDIDSELAVKLAGSRFSVLKNDIAKMQRALIHLMLDLATKNGYQEHYVPYIANADSLQSTGQLPKFEEDLFKLTNDMYLIPTAEVPLTNLYRDTIIDSSSLPIKLTSHTPCFRSEAGSYGLDTKGIIRQHQFEKVELVQIVHPNHSQQALEDITLQARSILDELELPYQIVELCTGDLGFSSQKTYDLEVWFPSQNKYREISSCSNFGDFQSRRLNIKFKEDKKKNFVHTLNGSGLAVGRTLAALVENCFDGKQIIIPSVLHKYLDFKTIELS